MKQSRWNSSSNTQPISNTKFKSQNNSIAKTGLNKQFYCSFPLNMFSLCRVYTLKWLTTYSIYKFTILILTYKLPNSNLYYLFVAAIKMYLCQLHKKRDLPTRSSCLFTAPKPFKWSRLMRNISHSTFS